MSYYVAGDTIEEPWIAAGLATGLTFTRVASHVNGSAVTWNPTITEVSNGAYYFKYVSATTDTTGSWVWIATASNGETVTWEFDLNETSATVVISAATTGSVTQTLAQLRARVAYRLGDYVQLTATANGTTTTFIDKLWVNTATEDMKGRIIVFSDTGEVARITAMNDATWTLTFTPDVASSATTNTGSLAEVYNKRGKGFRPDEYKNAINYAITDAFPLGKIRIRATVAAAFDTTAPEVTVPASMTHVSLVEYADTDSKWHTIPQGLRHNEHGWVADAAAGQLRIQGSFADAVDGLNLRLYGFGRQDILSADSDTCALNSEWIVARACYHLCLASIDKDDRYGQLAGAFMNESQSIRTRLRVLTDGAVAVRAA